MRDTGSFSPDDLLCPTNSFILSIPPETKRVRDDKWPSSRRQRDAGGDRVDRNSSIRRRRLLTRTGVGRAIKVGTRDDFVRLTWMPSSVQIVRGLSLDCKQASSEEARMSQSSR